MLPFKSQLGYIGLTVISFLIVLSMILMPWSPPPKAEDGCIAGEVPSGSEPILRDLPAIKNVNDDPRDNLGETAPNLAIGGPDPDVKTDYVLVRKNVPTLEKSIPNGWTFLGGTEKTGFTHTVKYGEVPQKPGYDAYYPAEWGEMDYKDTNSVVYIREVGFLILVKNDPSTIKEIPGNKIFLADIYQDVRFYNEPNKFYDLEELFVCWKDKADQGFPPVVSNTNVVIPPQATSEKKDQLQLEWFVFQEGVWGVHCKPAVYLYPPKKQLVNVKVNPRGELSYTDPVYDPVRGWTVEAFPDGHLFNSHNSSPITHNYLYYESKIPDSEIKKPTKGWSIKKDEMESLFNKILPKLGLNEKEKKDFMEYWLGKLPESSYYFVGLMEKEQRDYLEPLEVTPNPETSIRFSLYFEMLDQSKIVEEPVIKTPNRNGFTLVDWGGMIKLHPGTPFTCSQ